jgi:DNA helicase-2/ATP-dependent DNA helicase PcrA
VQLNPQQAEAVGTIDGPLLVLAGAGSGKTRVIAERILEMLRRSIPAAKILALTFTNKAAGEMRQRVQERAGRSAEALTISTFHSLGLRIVREFAADLGLRQPVQILDESETRSILRRVCARTQTALGRDVDRVSRAMSEARNEGLSAEALQASDDDLAYALGLLMARYDKEKRILGGVDFDDLLLLPLRLLRAAGEPAAKLKSRWSHALVDEYQDTNTLQFEFLRHLFGRCGNLCVVGDDDQGIYGWRGADHRNILHFEKHFDNCRCILLTANYRCRGPVLAVANQLISKNRQRRAKELVAARGDGPPVRLQVFSEGGLEAEVIVTEIARLVRRGTRASQIAILVRRAAQVPAFESELARRKLPVRLIGGKRTADRKASRDLFAYIQVLASDANEVAFRRAITTPSRGLGATSIETLASVAAQQKIGIVQVGAEHLPKVRPSARQALTDFQESVGEARLALGRGERPGPVLRALLDASSYRERVGEEIKNDKALGFHLKNLDRIIDLAEKAFDDPSLGSKPLTKLNSFVNRMNLSASQDEAEDQTEKITLSTIHGVKGLEFDRVYVVGLEEGSLPAQRALDSGDSGEVEEERRLLYVAATRARDHLTLSRAATRAVGEYTRERLPSRFLADLVGLPIEEELIGEVPRRDEVEAGQDYDSLRARMAALGVVLPEAES